MYQNQTLFLYQPWAVSPRPYRLGRIGEFWLGVVSCRSPSEGHKSYALRPRPSSFLQILP